MQRTLVIGSQDSDHIWGSELARIELIEYGDFQCPHCIEAHASIKFLRKSLVPQIRFIYRHFPLTAIHQSATRASVFAEAAGRQDRYWEMFDYLFENPTLIPDFETSGLAETLSLNPRQFAEDCNDPALMSKILNDHETGHQMGVTGTPSLFINGVPFKQHINLPGLLNACSEILLKEGGL
ncbi:MAG: thioredoxin domain-containing protein [Chitinophagaceae bacterium]